MKASTIRNIFAEETKLHSDTPHTVDTGALENFTAVLKAAVFDDLNDHAVRLRQKLEPSINLTDLSCRLNLNASYGAYNIVFPLEFSDGKTWLIRIPHTGTAEKFKAAEALNMTAEVRVMQLLKRQTSIPLPTVYDFDASYSNCFRVPYIIMEWIQGCKLTATWKDFTIEHEQRVKRNSQTLRELAAAVMQLNAFTFSRGGSPLFKSDGTLLPDVGPFLQETWTEGEGRGLESNEPTERAYKSLGPYSTWEDFVFQDYKPFLVVDDDGTERSKVQVAKLFQSWVPECQQNELPFVLVHPDLDVQNIIVDEQGHVLSIIDWDHIRAVPRCVGNEAYPKWLASDMDYYGHREFVQEGEKTNDGRDLSAKEMAAESTVGIDGGLGWWVAEDSPEDIETYRAVWDQAVGELGGAKAQAVARSSLLLANMYTAIREPMFFLNRFEHIQALIQDQMVALQLIAKDRILVLDWEKTSNQAQSDCEGDAIVESDGTSQSDASSITSPDDVEDLDGFASSHISADLGQHSTVSKSTLLHWAWKKITSSLARLAQPLVSTARKALKRLKRSAHGSAQGANTPDNTHDDNSVQSLNNTQPNPPNASGAPKLDKQIASISNQCLEPTKVAGTFEVQNNDDQKDKHSAEDVEREDGGDDNSGTEDGEESEGHHSNNGDEDHQPTDLRFFCPTLYEDAIRDGTFSDGDRELLKQGFRLFVS